MGDETPLAFAAPTLNAMPVSPVAPVAPAVPEAPKPEPMPSAGSSYLPPVPPAPISTPPVDAKPKSKFGLKMVGLMIGVLALIGGIGYGSWWIYFTNYSEPAKIAGVITESKNKASCNGCLNGGWLVWRDGGCKVTGICGNEAVVDKNTDNPNASTTLDSKGTCEGAQKGYVWCSSVDSTGKAYAFCNTKGIGCNQAAVEQGYTINYGSSVSTIPKDGWTACECGTGITLYFQKSGVCNQAIADKTGGYLPNTNNETNYNKMGLCALGGKYTYKADGTPVFTLDQFKIDIADNYYCDENGCYAKNGNCISMKYKCDKQITGRSCTDNEKPGTTFDNTCGKVEQIDIMCSNNGTMQYVESRTRINGACDATAANENPTTHKACNLTTKVCETVTGPGTDTCTTDANCVTAAPVLACTGLTQTPVATPTIGQTVTFTCAGTITPAAAATLSYKFRYSLDNGADQLLTNTTATTAQLAITACGTYSVQCKVCATIAGVLTCDPTWTGAVQ
jgi:hypothetical protein